MKRALFLDLDHTLIRPLEGRTFPLDEHDWVFIPGMMEAITPYLNRGDMIIIISNQGGIEAGFQTRAEVERKIEKVLRDMLWNIKFHDYQLFLRQTTFFYCPTNEKADRDRKPNPGMILKAQSKHGIDLASSLFVGDMDSDQEAAAAAGVPYKHVVDFIAGSAESIWSNSVESPKRCSDCHGGDFFQAIAEDKSFTQDFCNVCKEPCAVISVDAWKAKQNPTIFKSTTAVTSTAAIEILSPNASRAVYGIIGTITCINVARQGEPEKIKYFGKGKGCSGQAHETEAQAEQDIHDWHADKHVGYPMQAIVPLPKQKGITPSRTIGSIYGTPEGGSFVIGPNNTWPQAWEAMLGGHMIRRKNFSPEQIWILNGEARQIELVKLDAKGGHKPWQTGHPHYMLVSTEHMLATDWIVLPKIHLEPITV